MIFKFKSPDFFTAANAVIKSYIYIHYTRCPIKTQRNELNRIYNDGLASAILMCIIVTLKSSSETNI